jgi:hypothetical protein
MIYLQHEGFKRIEQNNKWGFLETNCKVAVKPTYEYAYPFSNGFAKVKVGKNWGFLNTNGEFLTQAIFEDADKF